MYQTATWIWFEHEPPLCPRFRDGSGGRQLDGGEELKDTELGGEGGGVVA